MTLEHKDIRQLLEVGIVAARLAGQRAMEEIKYCKSSIKNGNEIVTNADIVCQDIIINRIKETYPDHGFIAEEGPDGNMLVQLPRTAENIWWVIDPIDGTNNYAHKMLNFAVSVAVMKDGFPVAGIIFEPATESMYTAAEETDAQLNASRINVTDEAISKFASISLDSHFEPEFAPVMLDIMTKTRYRNLGTTALHLAYVAKGSLIAAVTTIAKVWDIAAGVIIIERAGGIVTDHAGNSIFPMDLTAYQPQNIKTLAANKKTHPEILKLLNA